MIFINTYTLQEFAKICKTTEQQIITNFPSTGIRLANQGKIISKTKNNQNITIYFYEDNPKMKINKEQFQELSQKLRDKYNKIYSNLSNEKWIDCYFSDKYEVSDQGRIRNKKTGQIIERKTDKGYLNVNLEGKVYFIHRLVLQSFQPVDNYNNMTVDHINGIRTDNRLENLQWISLRDNLKLMELHRDELNKELTRIINIYGYDNTLKKLQSIK